MARRQQNVCRDFQKGNCRFGAQCKFSHDVGQAGGGRPQKNIFGSNSFGALATGGKTQATPAKAPDKAEHKCENPRVCQDQIREDFQNEKPKWWTLSAYAHWKYLPNDVSGDVSFEELRWDSYSAARQGVPLQQVAAQEQQRMQSKESEFQQLVLNPYRGPGQTLANPSQPSNGALLFGRPASPANQAFGQTGFGQPANQPVNQTFGQGGFGQPANQPVSQSFGQSGFGQPASFGAAPQATSPFGQTQTQTQTSVFGSSPSQSGFGQTPSSIIFGAKPAAPSSPFGTPSQTPSPFGGQPLTTPQTPAQTPFGGGTIFGRQAVSGSSAASGFGGFGPQAATPAQNIFGRTPGAATPSPFGGPQGGGFGTQTAPLFGSGGSSAPFGSTPQAQRPFGISNGDMSGQQQASLALTASIPPSIDPGDDPNRDVWLAPKFELGKIPEEEPPLYAR